MDITLCSACKAPIEGRMFGRTARGDRWCEPCWQVENAEDTAQDAKIDRWHAGYFAETRPTDPDELEGWMHRQNEAPYQPVVRPEGYYHLPLGSFD